MDINPNNPEGNPEDENVVLSKAEHEELVKKLEKESQDKANLVEEIKELRKKKQITEAEAEELKKKIEESKNVNTDIGELTPEKIAEIASKTTQEILNKNTEATIKSNKESALSKFKEKHKEFHNDNDEGGIKMSVLEKKLERFNTTNLKSEEDFLSIFEDAYALIGKSENSEIPENNIQTESPSGGSAPKEFQNTNLTPKEIEIVNRTFNGDKERYLKIKAKRPDYVANLIQGKHY